ncbi:MAG: succinate dehydrogenase, cytochrome b556 subunit, partial [Alphaproteobacteria bacterium]
MDPANRPLSPHLQIYRPQITSVLSILHRLSGVGLGVGTLLLTYWLISVAAGPGPF